MFRSKPLARSILTWLAVLVAPAASAMSLDYAVLNKDYSTFSINDYGQFTSDTDNPPLFRMFNKHFEAEIVSLGITPYTSSDQMFRERGVDMDGLWTTNNATLYAAFKAALFEHDLYLTYPDGVEKLIAHFPSGTFACFDGAILDKVDWAIEDMTDFDWKLGYLHPTIPSVNGWYSSHSELNYDGIIHMVAFDVTDVMQQRYGNGVIQSAYLMGWEDMWARDSRTDYDYQDLAMILTNVFPGGTGTAPAVPEPITLLTLGTGVSLLAMRWRRARKKQSQQPAGNRQ